MFFHLDKVSYKLSKNSAFANKTLMFTGTLTSLTRAEAESIVKDNGGTILSGVTAKLNILVVGEDAGSKLEKAKNLGTVKILTEKDFLKMVPSKAAAPAAKTGKASAAKAKSTKVQDQKFSTLRLGRTENQIVYADFNSDNVDLDQVKRYLKEAVTFCDYAFENIFSENGLLRLEQGANDYTEFFQLFNPEVLFAVYQQPFEGYITINFCEDPTAYIYDDYGNLFKNVTLSLSRGDGEFVIGLSRDHTYNYDDIDDITDRMLNRIKKIMDKDNANKTWEDLTIPVEKEMTLDRFKALFYSHFSKKDIWL